MPIATAKDKRHRAPAALYPPARGLRAGRGRKTAENTGSESKLAPVAFRRGFLRRGAPGSLGVLQGAIIDAAAEPGLPAQRAAIIVRVGVAGNRPLLGFRERAG